MPDEIVRVAIVGSRRYENKRAIKDTIFELQQRFGDRLEIVSGECKSGADKYARKFALGGLLLIDDNSDVDSMDNSKEVVKLPELKPKTPEWTNVVKGLKGGYKMKDVETKYSVTEANKKKLNEDAKKEV